MKEITNYIVEKLKISKEIIEKDKYRILSEDEFFSYVKELCRANKYRSIIDQYDPVISVNEDAYPYMLLKYYDNKFFSIVENDYVGVSETITIVTGRNNCYVRTPYKGKKLDIYPNGNLKANRYNIDKIFEIFKNVKENGKVSK